MLELPITFHKLFQWMAVLQDVNINFVIESDKKLLNEGVPLYKRSILVAIELCNKNNIQSNLLNPDFFELYVNPIHEIYKSLYPNGEFSFPPITVGAIVIRGISYTVKLPIIYGEVSINLIDLMDISTSEINLIYNLYPEDFWQAHYSFCDICDFGYGADDLIRSKSPASNFLERALEQLASTSTVLVHNRFIEPVAQSILLTAELALKATLIHLGLSEKECRNIGHSHFKLMLSLSKKLPKYNDDLLLKICSNFPNYVNSRYYGSGLNDKELSEIAMGAQFIAAECMRRITDRNLLKYMENKLDYPRTYNF